MLEDEVLALGNFHSPSRATWCGKAIRKTLRTRIKITQLAVAFQKVVDTTESWNDVGWKGP